MTTQPSPQFFNASQARSPTPSNATPLAGSFPNSPVSGWINFVFPAGKTMTGKFGYNHLMPPIATSQRITKPDALTVRDQAF
jgi:hypothetical protein